MKKLLLLSLFALGFTREVIAQPSIASRVANNIVRNDNAVTFKTSGASIHPGDVGYGIDSCLKLTKILRDSVIAGVYVIPQGLQETLDQDNNSTTGIELNSAAPIHINSGGYVTTFGSAIVQLPNTFGGSSGSVTLNCGQSGNSGDYQIFVQQTRDGVIAMAGDGITPTIAIGGATGSGGSVSIISGDDNSGVIRISTGTGCASGVVQIARITFNTAYETKTRVVLFAESGPSCSILSHIFCISDSRTDFQIVNASGSLADSTIYLITYLVQK